MCLLDSHSTLVWRWQLREASTTRHALRSKVVANVLFHAIFLHCGSYLCTIVSCRIQWLDSAQSFSVASHVADNAHGELAVAHSTWWKDSTMEGEL